MDFVVDQYFPILEALEEREWLSWRRSSWMRDLSMRQ